MTAGILCRVAVAAPLHQEFDYFSTTPVAAGQRVAVQFGRRKLVGVVTDVGAEPQIETARIKPVREVLDSAPLLDELDMKVLRFAAAYYQHPIGEVIVGALPKSLRSGGPAEVAVTQIRLTDTGRATDPADLKRAPRQREVLEALLASETGVDLADLRGRSPALVEAVRRLEARDLVVRDEVVSRAAVDYRADNIAAGPELSDAQSRAVTAINAADGFEAIVLNGVTGSGKTEVYLRTIEPVVRAGRQALVLVPEIALTPQLVTRFERRFAAPVVALHSGLNDGQRLRAWRDARAGRAAIVIGTRSAVFTPLCAPGIVIVDEEHDGSFKQQEGFRYHGRDVAVYRARALDVPIVMGSATPTLETLHNVRTGRYRQLDLPERVGRGTDPKVRLIDLREEAVDHGISGTLMAAMHRHLNDGAQVMLYLNRRGYAPAWFCSGCGAIAACRECDANMTFHSRTRSLRCHHCGAARAAPEVCESCGAEHKPVGQGTERIEEYLAEHLPGARVARLDRDTTRRRGALDELLERTRKHQVDVLVGTQMLTKGHHFAGVAMVGVLNADHGLFSADFRAGERLAQTVVQVCGRAGRGERPGEVYIQTAFAEHPLLRELITEGYGAFVARATAERRSAHWPPFSHLALLRARGADEHAPMQLLDAVRRVIPASGDLTVLGPASAPMRRRASEYHAQLLLQSPDRAVLAGALYALRAPLAELLRGSKVRVAIDVDPVDLY
ncbi:MAG: primosomal protein N' [Pseudomonadota bacterium]